MVTFRGEGVLWRRETGTLGSAALSLSSPIPSLETSTSRLTTVLVSTLTTTSESAIAKTSSSVGATSIAKTVVDTTSSQSQSQLPTSSPWHYVQPPPDPPSNHVVASICVAIVLFSLGLAAGVIWLFRQRYLVKRNERESKLSIAERERLEAGRRNKRSKGLWRNMGW